MATIESLLEIAVSNAGSAALLALMAALAELGMARFGRRRPAVVHGLWLLVLVKLLTPPIYELGIPLPSSVSPAAAPLPSANSTVTQGSAFTVPVTIVESPRPTLTVEKTILGLWLLGALGLASLAVIRTIRFQRALAGTEPATPSFQDRVAALASGVGVRRPPRAVMMREAVSPMLWATPRSCFLVVSEALIHQLTARETDTLIAHELAHLRRGDHRVRYLEIVAKALFWWHPVAWWASRRLRRAEEECCDLLVTRTLPEHRRVYADGLLKTTKFLARAGRARHTLGSGVPATGAGEVHDLKRRLTMIMKPRPSRPLSTHSRVALALAALALLAVFPTVADNRPEVVTRANWIFTGEAMDFDPRGASLGEVIRQLAKKTDLNIVIDPEVDLSLPVTTRFKGIPWDQILATVVQDLGLSYAAEGRVLWISGSVPIRRNVYFRGEPISVNVENADLRETLQQIVDRAHGLIELDPRIKGTVTVHLESVPWDQVVDTIIRVSHLGYKVEGRVIKVIIPGDEYE